MGIAGGGENCSSRADSISGTRLRLTGMATRMGELERMAGGVGGVGLRGGCGGGVGSRVAWCSSSSSSSLVGFAGRVGRPGIGIPRPALGLLDVSSGGGLGADRLAPVAEAPMGGASLKRSRMALMPAAGDVGASCCCDSSSCPVRCWPMLLLLADLPVCVVGTGAHDLPA